MSGVTSVMADPTTVAIAIDVGGTGVRVRIDDDSARSPVDLEQPGARITDGGLDLRAIIDSARAAVARVADVGDRGIAVAVGSTGLPDLVEDPRPMLEELRTLGVRRIVLVADAVTAHVGALDLAPGVVVAAGTGVVALGTDLESVWHRVDGWGHLLGDDGGGAWIGMHGLRAALRARDGRAGGSVVLDALAAARFGPSDALVREVYTRPDRAGLMAAFAPDVFLAASDGDAVASSIVDRAGAHLADAAVAALDRSDQRVVTYSGRLFLAGDVLLAPMAARVLAATGVDLTVPLGTPLDGAMTLARLAAHQPERLPRSPHNLIITIGDAA